MQENTIRFCAGNRESTLKKTTFLVSRNLMRNRVISRAVGAPWRESPCISAVAISRDCTTHPRVFRYEAYSTFEQCYDNQ